MNTSGKGSAATLPTNNDPAVSVRTTGSTSVHEILRAARLPAGPFSLYALPVSAGFPSPADGYIESRLDLNRHCIQNPVSTYFARVGGESWGALGVVEGDELVVDRALDPVDDSLVLADIDGTRSLFRTIRRKNRIELIDGFDNHYGSGFMIWGVVTFIIRGLR